MQDYEKISTVLQHHFKTASTSFSIGTFGAIAEFHQDAGEMMLIDEPGALRMMSERGAIQLSIPDGVQAVAYEAVSANHERWQQGVALCLPVERAVRAKRKVLTELGPDRQALCVAEKQSVLFDIGVDAVNIDFCIRTEDTVLIALLRSVEGQSFLNWDKPVMDELIKVSPARVVMSNLGRIEVYQPIATEKTPAGPHTHLLPKLLAKGRTHSANIPIPDNLLPCLMMHPANPLLDQFGQPIPFDLDRFRVFEGLLELWGSAEYLQEKKRIQQAVLSGQDPSEYSKAGNRGTRAATRIALRQMKQLDEYQLSVGRWLEYFSRHEPAE